MSETVYSNAVAEAKRELDKLRQEHAELLDKMKALETFIRSGYALTGQPAPTGGLFVDTADRPPMGAAEREPPIADQVAQILTKAGKPLHIKQIIRQLREVRVLKGKNVTANVIVAIKRRGSQFKKAAPNTFTLSG